MKVLLLQDVYNLGRAGDIKKVANGYGRNYLIPQGLAVLATPQALKEVERIREEANKRRAIVSEEMSGVAENMADLMLFFSARAGETGKLYGSITTMMVSAELTEKLGVKIDKRQIDTSPLRLLGMHTVRIRLTVDIIPEIKVVVYREGESPDNYMIDAEVLAARASDELEFEDDFEDEEDEVVEETAEEAVEETAEESAEDTEAEESTEEESPAEEPAEAEESEAEEAE